MKNAIFHFEIKSWLKSPMLYFFVACYFLLALITMLGTGDYFDGPIATDDQVQVLNSSYSLCFISFIFSKFSLFILAIIIGNSLVKDYKNQTHALLFTYPISKSYYLNGKLGSALFVLLLACLLTFLGLFLGEILLGETNPKIQAFNPWAYLLSLGIYHLPTMLIISLFVFTVVGISRNIFSGFIVVIAFVLFQLTIENIFFNQKNLLAILDPFGQHAFQLATQNWDMPMQNSASLPINKVVIFNRIFWIFLASMTYVFYYKKFNFQFHGIWNTRKKEQKNEIKISSEKTQSDQSLYTPLDFSAKAQWQSFIELLVFDVRAILKDKLFWVLTGFGILTLFFIQFKVTNTGAFNLLPTTRLLLGSPLNIYAQLIIMSTFLFSGMLLHRAKKYNMHALIDVSPTKSGQLFGSKVGAIAFIQILQLLLFLCLGIGIQLYNQHPYIEFPLYLFHLFLIVFPSLLIWNITSYFVHSLVPNIFIGLFFLLAIWLGLQSLDQMGIHSHLFKFNETIPLSYSDFHQYGHQLKGFFLITSYWLSFSFILGILSLLLWNRGNFSSWAERLSLLKSRINKWIIIGLLLSTAHFVWYGAKIYQAEKVDLTLTNNNKKATNHLNSYKANWEEYADLSQPKIKAVKLKIDLFPNRQLMYAKGRYLLVNDTKETIDTIFIQTGFDEQTTLSWQDREVQLLKEDQAMKSTLFKLKEGLNPMDSIWFSFEIKNTNNTLFKQNSNILSNGSFIKQDILPRLGYPFHEGSLPLSDALIGQHHYFHRDADLVDFHTTISTSKDQTAIAPGHLIDHKKEANRNIYIYKTKHPVKFNCSFHSGNFRVQKISYQGIDIEFFHQKNHGQNTTMMLEGIKAALDYNTQLFGPYPYPSIRIIEFPHTAARYSATLMANNIPTSEILFNINLKAMEEKINLPFYVMAHELTHEWFGNQVMPADAEGAKMLTESITEYITLCIYRNHFGDQAAQTFLSTQKQRYLRGKKKEKKEEKPLYKVQDHQEYIAYGKGAIVLNHLDKHLGSSKMHTILKAYVSHYKRHLQPYPTTEDFIQLMYKHTLPAQHQEIDKWLKEVVDIQEIIK